jgi:SPX domain protein involved in polyphosphate accumulation
LDELIERYEFKYLVPERLVPEIRATALTTSKIDRYADVGGTYLIRSLYFDTARFDLYWANGREQGDRFKMRVRVYPGKKSPVFLEVKRRVKDVIIKTRAPVPADAWLDVIAGREAALSALSPSVRTGSINFIKRVHRHHLEPVALIEYEREAYVSEVDSYARLTFDRKITVQPRDRLDLEASPGRWRAVDHVMKTQTPEPVCVLELKFERRPPAWMSALVRRLDLVRRSFSKYCYGVNAELTLPELRSARLAWGEPA